MLNPAFTGKFNTDYRVAGVHRRQWMELNTPYITNGITGEINVRVGSMKYNMVGLGLNIASDQLGRNSENGRIFSNTHIVISGAYHAYLDEFLRHKLSAGIQTGFSRKSFDASGLYFGNQIENYAYSITLSSGENTAQPYLQNLNINFGLAYQFKVKQNFEFEAGLSIFNILPSKESISNLKGKLPPRFVFNLSSIYQINSKLSFKPHILYMNQALTSDFILGGLVGFHFLNTRKSIFYAGAFHRLNESFIPTLAMQYGNFYFGISYDLNVVGPKKLVSAVNIKRSNLGSIEFTLVYGGFLKRILPPRMSVPCGIL